MNVYHSFLAVYGNRLIMGVPEVEKIYNRKYNGGQESR